ncbi:MAG: response regulator, partial [Shewanella sp.]
MINSINPTTHIDSINVLLVDDVNINLVLGERLLAKLGVSVSTANSGAQCLQKMAQHEYQLILLDIHMEPMSGIETMS